MLAQERAESCHPDPTHRDPMSNHVGWNALRSAPGATSFSEVIDSWFQEGQDYNYLSGQCQENHTCRLYTQVIRIGGYRLDRHWGHTAP